MRKLLLLIFLISSVALADYPLGQVTATGSRVKVAPLGWTVSVSDYVGAVNGADTLVAVIPQGSTQIGGTVVFDSLNSGSLIDSSLLKWRLLPYNSGRATFADTTAGSAFKFAYIDTGAVTGTSTPKWAVANGALDLDKNKLYNWVADTTRNPLPPFGYFFELIVSEQALGNGGAVIADTAYHRTEINFR